MMKKLTFIFGIITLNLGNSFAQETIKTSFQQGLPTIAVANPYVNGIESKSETVAKMIRLELIKMQQYKVYDEFDMLDVLKTKEDFRTECYGQNCLLQLGSALNTDYVMCGSIDGLSNRIAVTIKIVDVKGKTIYKSMVKEFDNQEFELQRMLEIVLKEMHDTEMQKEVIERLEYKNEPITSTNVGRINNSGPRIGGAYLTGSTNEFAQRNESQGGLGIQPYVSMIGYQFEKQYVGTENFSALLETIINVSGLEQGQFIPSFTIMNGFRFGKAGWELAFGPGLGIKKTSTGFFDSENKFSNDSQYFTTQEWEEFANRTYANDPQYIQDGQFVAPSPSDFNSNYRFAKHGDTRGATYLNTTFVFAIGRTFHAGALNIPVNAFYSAQKGGGMVGLNIGFNVQKSKLPIHH
jgi:TolB-like protein